MSRADLEQEVAMLQVEFSLAHQLQRVVSEYAVKVMCRLEAAEAELAATPAPMEWDLPKRRDPRPTAELPRRAVPRAHATRAMAL